MKLFEKIFIPLGMLGILFYIIHTTLGRILWEEYDPITMDISSLTAVGAPNAPLLSVFTTLYAIFVILFSVGMVIKSFRIYHRTTQIGFIILLVMEFISFVGYGLFPLEGDKTEMTFQNLMHIIVTAIVVITTIAFGFVLATGYIKKEKMIGLGRFVLVMAVIITIMGFTTPIGMGAGLGILGITERMAIYSLQTLIFALSCYYTFFYRESGLTNK